MKEFTPKAGAVVFRGKEGMLHVIGANTGKCKVAVTAGHGPTTAIPLPLLQQLFKIYPFNRVFSYESYF